MADTIFDERMSASDALTWKIESDPALRSTIVGLWLLDRTPDFERLRDRLERATRVIPRLRQRVVEDPLGAAPPRWATDANFDLQYHLRRVRAPADRGLRDCLKLAEPVAMQAFDRDRPLWEATLIEDVETGGTAPGSGVMIKLHHAISDGVGLVYMTRGLIERSAEPPAEAEPLPPAPEPEPDAGLLLEEALQALRHRAGRRIEQGRGAAAAVVQGLSSLVRRPIGATVDALQDTAEIAASARRLLAPASEPRSPVLRGRSLSCRLHAFTRPLERMKAAGRRASGTLNDAFVAGVAGGMRRYHQRMGQEVERLRMTMPINLRSGVQGRHAGNQFAPVRFPVPVGLLDPVERMRAIHALVAAERSEPSLPVVGVIAAALGQLPEAAATAALGAMLKSVDFITSNVPGPHFPVYLAGARLTHLFAFGPLSGAAANVVLFSYDGSCQIGINADPAAVTDFEGFSACVEEGLDEVLAVA